MGSAAAATLSNGGTESIVLAVDTYVIAFRTLALMGAFEVAVAVLIGRKKIDAFVAQHEELASAAHKTIDIAMKLDRELTDRERVPLLRAADELEEYADMLRSHGRDMSRFVVFHTVARMHTAMKDARDATEEMVEALRACAERGWDATHETRLSKEARAALDQGMADAIAGRISRPCIRVSEPS